MMTLLETIERYFAQQSGIILCRVDGCTKPAKCRGLCGKHYMRRRRHGDPTISLHDGIKESSHGYVLQFVPGHFLANAGGYVYQHRLRIFERHGYSVRCHYCPRQLSFFLKYPQSMNAVCVDHRNGDKSDNSPKNIVPCCGPCNNTQAAKRRRLTRARAARKAA